MLSYILVHNIYIGRERSTRDRKRPWEPAEDYCQGSRSLSRCQLAEGLRIGFFPVPLGRGGCQTIKPVELIVLVILMFTLSRLS